MIKWDENEPTLILRDENGDDIDFKDDENTLQMRDNLKLINRSLQKNAILLYVPDTELKKINKRLNRDPQKSPIDFTQKRVRRIFNNKSFEEGGRFYGGWWQNIPKEYRKYIRLNDKDVVELDYSGLHINMLYAMEKLPVPKGDVYHLSGYSNDATFREFVKKLLQAVVNAPDREKARKGLHADVYKKKELELPTEVGSTRGDDIFPLMDAFERKHHKIKHYFCTGKGIDLQYLDSQMSEKVLLTFSKMGYAILPMHDSFIIHHALKDELEEAMDNAFYEMFGVRCKVDLKYNSIEERHKEQGEELEICDASIEELFEDNKYSTYERFLNQHWKYKHEKGLSRKIVNESSKLTT
jgi:hypothetical protein